jgi:membrane-associated PAP2 superfamily phosphatase
VLDRAFWRNHAAWPAALFLIFAALAATTGLDEAVAWAWAFEPAAHRFIGSGPGEWWAKDLIHSGGGLLIRILGGLVILTWLLSYRVKALWRWRRPLSYVVLSVALGAGLVGLLKEITNVDCPWSLREFGGKVPYVHLLGDRLDTLPRAQCFPGGHSSSGFALFAIYFLLLGRSRKLARWALGIALLVGGLFAFGQEARGAHFLSHDLWSAAVVWFACLAVYTLGFRGDLWSPATGNPT